jgi:RNA polymerase sigma-70 factor (ECF subfamily)
VTTHRPSTALADSYAPDDTEDAARLARLRAGDERAFEELVRLHGGRLLAVTQRLLGHTEDARDAVQDAFLAAFRGLPRFEGQARLSTWLHRIAVNAALMKLRAKRRRPEAPIDDLLPRFDTDGHRIDDTVPDRLVDEEIDRAQQRAAVRRALDHLPEPYRTVLVLRDIEELDTEETAAALGTSPGAVKTRLHRARQALRSLVLHELAADETTRSATLAAATTGGAPPIAQLETSHR